MNQAKIMMAAAIAAMSALGGQTAPATWALPASLAGLGILVAIGTTAFFVRRGSTP